MKQKNLLNKNPIIKKGDYSNVLFRDKGDLTPQFLSRFSGCKILGAYEPLVQQEDIEILSVKYSKVGLKTVLKLPNLKYVVCRSHGTDNISKQLPADIIVKVASPTTDAVVEYILTCLNTYSCEPPYCLFGYGSIGKSLGEQLKEVLTINSKTSKEEIRDIVTKAKTLIITIPAENNQNLIDSLVFQNFHGKIISVARKSVFNLYDLEKALASDLFFVSDTSPFDLPEKALKNCIFTHHIAWSYSLDWGKYTERVAEVIDSCYDTDPSS